MTLFWNIILYPTTSLYLKSGKKYLEIHFKTVLFFFLFVVTAQSTITILNYNVLITITLFYMNIFTLLNFYSNHKYLKVTIKNQQINDH